MNYSFAELLYFLFWAKGFAGGSTNWHLTISFTPSVPVNCITVYDTTGVKISRLMDNGKVVQREGAMVRIRSADYITGIRKAQELVAFVDSVINERFLFDTAWMTPGQEGVSEAHIPSISRPATLLVLGTDPDTERREQFYSLNLSALIKQTVALWELYAERVEGDGGEVSSVESVQEFYSMFTT